MVVITRVQGVNQVVARLKQLAHAYVDSPDGIPGAVITGYAGVNYALYVHEIQATHKPGKSWKYLEIPARELNNSGELARVASQAVANGASLEKALVLAAQRIQRESQKIVPVKTGNLKGSAFTRVES